MKKVLRSAVLGLAGLTLITASSHGTTFNYSYQFDSVNKVWGSFEGTQNGAYVENVSSVSVFFNETEMDGSVFTAKRSPSYTWVNGAVVSFNVTENNFQFVNSNWAEGDYSAMQFFYISFDGAVAQAWDLGFDGAGYPLDQTRWSLTAVPDSTSVPDGGITMAMLGMAMTGMAFFRRKF